MIGEIFPGFAVGEIGPGKSELRIELDGAREELSRFFHLLVALGIIQSQAAQVSIVGFWVLRGNMCQRLLFAAS